MEDIKDKATDIWAHAEDLAGTYKDLAILNLTQKAVNISSAVVTTIIVYTAGLFILLFGALALSWWLGDVVESRAGGFLLGAVFFGIVMIVAIRLRKKILFHYFRDNIIRKLYKDQPGTDG